MASDDETVAAELVASDIPLRRPLGISTATAILLASKVQSFIASSDGC